MNGYKIYSTVSSALLTVDGAMLSVYGGEIETAKVIGYAEHGGIINLGPGSFISGNVAFKAVGDGSKVIVNDSHIQSVEGCVGAYDGAEININGGQLEASDNFAVFTNGTAGRGGNTIVINGGTIVGNIITEGYEAVGVYIANNDTFVMNGGEITANNGAGLVMRGGNVIINDGIIESSGEAGTTGKVGDNPTPMSKSAIIYHESANYPGKDGMSLTVNGGTIIGVDHSIEILSNEEEPNVTVTGGEFDPPYPENP